ncbi:MAG TPA: hypothetical protein DEB43_02590 [Desulfovibrio sp.]|nr:hypothetical protein [Desulfovibrio sp.]
MPFTVIVDISASFFEFYLTHISFFLNMCKSRLQIYEKTPKQQKYHFHNIVKSLNIDFNIHINNNI